MHIFQASVYCELNQLIPCVVRGSGYSIGTLNRASRRFGRHSLQCHMPRRCWLPVRQSTAGIKRRPSERFRACRRRLRCYCAHVLPLWQNALADGWPECRESLVASSSQCARRWVAVLVPRIARLRAWETTLFYCIHSSCSLYASRKRS